MEATAASLRLTVALVFLIWQPLQSQVVIRSAPEFVAVLANQTLFNAVLAADIVVQESDWAAYPSPILVSRNVTFVGITGRLGSSSPDASKVAGYRPFIDFKHLTAKVQLGDGVTLNMSHLIALNAISGNYNLAPRLDILTAIPPDASSATLIGFDSALVMPLCIPPEIQREASKVPRPPWLPGNQSMYIDSNRLDCVNGSNDDISFGGNNGGDALNGEDAATAAAVVPFELRCWAQIGQVEDLAVMGTGEANQRQVPLGYAISMIKSTYLCAEQLSEQCMAELGSLGCMQLRLKGGAPPPPPKPPPPPPKPPVPPVQLEPAPGGGGGSNGGGSGAPPLGVVLGGAVGGGVAVLAVVAPAVVLLRRRRRRRQHGGLHEGRAAKYTCRGDGTGGPVHGEGPEAARRVAQASKRCGQEPAKVSRELLGLTTIDEASESNNFHGHQGQQLRERLGRARALGGGAEAESGRDGVSKQAEAAAVAVVECDWHSDTPPPLPGARMNTGANVTGAPPQKMQAAKGACAISPSATTAGSSSSSAANAPSPRQQRPDAYVAHTQKADPLFVLSPQTPIRPDVLLLGQQGSTHGPVAQSSTHGSAPGPMIHGSDSATHGLSSASAFEVELLHNVLGRGGFGRVVEGRYRGMAVAVKLILDDSLGAWGFKPSGGAGGAGGRQVGLQGRPQPLAAAAAPPIASAAAEPPAAEGPLPAAVGVLRPADGKHAWSGFSGLADGYSSKGNNGSQGTVHYTARDDFSRSAGGFGDGGGGGDGGGSGAGGGDGGGGIGADVDNYVSFQPGPHPLPTKASLSSATPGSSSGAVGVLLGRRVSQNAKNKASSNHWAGGGADMRPHWWGSAGAAPSPPDSQWQSDDSTRDHLVEALAAEVEVLGRCCHPNIVKLLAACLKPPRLCLVLERMDVSLDKLIYGVPGRFIPLDEVLSIALDVARGLEYLHPTVVHRDIKPANVLINRPLTPNMVAKLSDFGLSRLRDTIAMWTENPEVGTPEYMAPELYNVNNNVVTHKVDVYSFAVLLWAMLSGKRPWQGLQIAVIGYRVNVEAARPPLESIPVDRLPPKLSRLLQQCWDAEPARRPAAAEVVKQLLLVREQMSLREVNDIPSTATAAATPPTAGLAAAEAAVMAGPLVAAAAAPVAPAATEAPAALAAAPEVKQASPSAAVAVGLSAAEQVNPVPATAELGCGGD